MIAKVWSKTDDEASVLWGMVWIWIFAFMLCGPAFAQSQNVIESNTIIGLEKAEDALEPESPLMQALFERQQRLEEALFVLEDRINRVSELAQNTDQRIARGEDPLVSLEIEQLWVQIRSLEQENALLRETLEGAGVTVPAARGE